MNDQRNMMLAVLLSVAIIVGWMFLFPEHGVAPPPQPTQEQTADGMPAGDGGVVAPRAEDGGIGAPQPSAATGAAPLTPSLPGAGAPTLPRDAALAGDDRIEFDNGRISGSIRLRGARIDDALLADYRLTLDEDSPNVALLAPEGSADPYFAEVSWQAPGDLDTPMPDSNTVWTRVGGRGPIAPGAPARLRWDNGDGLVFDREIEIDENYVIAVTDTVTNSRSEQVALFPYGLVARIGLPEMLNFFILHEGYAGVFNGVLEEEDYDDIRDDGGVSYQSTGGWSGFSDKYWLGAILAEPDQRATFRFTAGARGSLTQFQTDKISRDAVFVPAGQSASATTRLFIGAKEHSLLGDYGRELGLPLFTRAIDFGWLFFITEYFFMALHWLFGIFGNYGVAILIFTLGIKILFFPLANKSYKSMSAMKKLQPEMMRLRDLYKDDKMRMQQELMGLYKKNKVNPASGCLPILIQIPIFFALYKVLFVTIEMRHAPFFGWIQDLSAPDPTSLFNLFGLLPYDVPSFLLIGIWPCIMGLSMWAQMKLNPAPTDEIQAKIFMFLPFVFTIMLASFPAGLVIYWTWNNILSIAQQYFIMRRMGVPIGGGVDKPEKAEKAG